MTSFLDAERAPRVTRQIQGAAQVRLSVLDCISVHNGGWVSWWLKR